MQNLFNYTTLSTRLEKTTRTLFVTLNRPDWQNAFRLEMLFELESLLAWCINKVEINSILFNSSTPFFSTGLDLQAMSEMNSQTLEKINTKLQKIVFSMMQLPQTIIIDLGQGCSTLASEFSLGADIRICSMDAKISFNHCFYGLIPAAGGMSMLSILASPSFARNCVLTGMPINQKALKDSGLITHVYGTEKQEATIHELLYSIGLQAPIQRIQAKLGLFESLRTQFENGIIMDKKIAKASMLSEDWRNRTSKEDNLNFMSAKSMSYSVKLSLIKNEDSQKNFEH
jgi:enoyl-CoA hydratase/carnithine racemase